MTARFIVGDTRAVLASMPDASVDLVLTSPPFLALRSYLPTDHPDKALEIGSEPTPGEFIDTLLDVVEACARVLAPHGTLAFELGDTYSGSGGAGGDYNADGLRSGQGKFDGSNHRRGKIVDEDSGRRNPGPGWPLDKSLCLIPESFRWALVYGRNPFTGRETPRWRARNVVRWCRPNPPVGALGDKFRPGTSEMVIVCKSRTRWFDLDAVRGPGSSNTHNRLSERDREETGSRRNRGKSANDEQPGGNFSTLPIVDSDGTAPPLDWWEIPTQPYSGSHYATWPERLVTRPIDAMCPREVCTTCGEPRRRITETANAIGEAVGRRSWRNDTEGKHTGDITRSMSTAPTADVRTLGWSDCGHGTFRRGIVLDPFAGSGTTLAVAEGLGRDSIGIDLDARNADLAAERVGMFLSVEPSEVPPIVDVAL